MNSPVNNTRLFYGIKGIKTFQLHKYNKTKYNNIVKIVKAIEDIFIKIQY